MSCVLITGASGFVGFAVVNRLAIHSEFTPRAAMRRDNHHFSPAVDVVQGGDLAPDTDWTAALQGVSAVVHAAARVHVMNDSFADSLSEFRRVNVEGTLNLARQAVSAGVTRFVFISSIKVNGERTLLGIPFTAEDAPAPVDAYGISKMEAEVGLRQIAEATGMELVIIRPPLVYGPGVKANFRNMMFWIYRGIPMPLGAIQNKRSLIALENLVGLIGICISHPAASNEIFLAADGEDVSTTEMIHYLASGMSRRVFLPPVPQSMLRKGLELLGKKNIAQRLCDNLQVDIRKTQERLGWVPSISTEDALRKTAQVFVEENKTGNFL